MNIKEAKIEISQAITAYFTKNEYDEYIIPIEKQRPVFLMGPPGIGKTAIMEQIAQEMGVGLVSYSMTHHTRQSALGLPFIVKKQYGEEEFSISEYTMSEIIASVYDCIEETGLKEGILFLDEINCVSETLAPAMLQFLQYKTFGRHKVPDGWIVVTAGNPPEFNNSVREFDIVTWDRLKRIDVEADYSVWKEYAYKVNVHPAIITYLDIKKGNFYKIESTIDGKSFVTARGWCDLSEMIKLYEKHEFKIHENLIRQYLQNNKIAKDFAVYYDLFNKYQSDYQIDSIIQGNVTAEIKNRAIKAKFDERLSLLGLLINSLTDNIHNTMIIETNVKELMVSLKHIKALSSKNSDINDLINQEIELKKNDLKEGKKKKTMPLNEQHRLSDLIKTLEEENKYLVTNPEKDIADAFKVLTTRYNQKVSKLKSSVNESKNALSNSFKFCEEVFDEGQELLIFVTELTMNPSSAQFISRYGCEEYFKHNKELLFYDRQKQIIQELNLLEND